MTGPRAVNELGGPVIPGSFGYLYIPNITAKYCHFIYPSDSVTFLRVC